MTWRGFTKESKEYTNYPGLKKGEWAEWNAQLYLADGKPDLNYIGWTNAQRRKAILKFWLQYPRAWLRFHWSIVRDEFKKVALAMGLRKL